MEEHFVHNIIIPPSPNWCEPSVMTYTPNDMLIYGFKGDLIIISNMANKSPEELVAVKIIRRAHCQRITSVAVNSKFGEDSSLLVTTAEDKYVKLWDMERFEIKLAHHQHGRSNRIVSAAFAGSHKVVSVSDDGHIIVWSFNNNEKLHMTNIFNPNMTPTSMSICPHDPSLAAFGMKSGLIVVVNLEGTGQVVCHLRGHYKEVISMDWCPIPFNIFPKNPNNEVYITPEQFRAAGSEGTAALVQELIDEILDSVSILAQHALDMAGSKQSTIKDSAAAQTAPQTSTEMTPGANVEENQRLDKALPKLLDLIALTLIIWRVGSMDTMQTTVKLPPANKQKKKGNSKDKLWITVKWPVPNKIYCSSGNNELIQWTIPKAEGDGLKLIHGDHSGLIFSIATNWKIPSEHLVWTTSCDKQLICYRIDGEVAEVQKLAMYPTFAGVPECLARNEVNPFRVAIGTSGGILKIWDLTEATPKIVSMEILTQRIHTRVGLFNLENRTGRLHVMPQCFTKQIIKIQWAPGYNDVYGLYITAEGRLVVWDAETPEADFSCLLISFQRCLVKTYSASLQDMDTFRTPHELGLLAWNPLSLTGDFSKEPFCMMSAAVLNTKTMVVMDHSRKTNQFEEKIAGKFGTKGHINVIVWNNFGTRLAIGTEDGFVFVSFCSLY
nr:unnamed protein product [Callosobruchus chinensis]